MNTEAILVDDSPATDDVVSYDHEATYSPEDNKLRLYPAYRLSKEDYERVKAAGFIWAAKQELFVAPMWTPQREDFLLEVCGEIGDEGTTREERAEQRAERFGTYKAKRAADAERARDAVQSICDGIPFGQPILVGHHSERHARRDQERIETGMRRAVNMWETSQYWKSRATGALSHAKYLERADVRARRIKVIEADKRRELRSRDEADMWLKLWTECAAENDATLQAGVALRIAGMCHLRLPRKDGDREGWTYTPTAYDAITNLHPSLYAPRTLQEIFDAAQRTYPAIITNCDRWIAHCDNRLLYERAMLEEQGASHLLEKAPRPKQLPLCNYRAPEGISAPNIYHRGELIHYSQVEMTQAEYAKIYNDYKGTRVVDNSHRIRTAMIKHSLVCVFLTDSKTHERPAPVVAPRKETAPPKPARTWTPPARTEFDDMKDTLRNGGVQVAVAPQLFPTPPDLAARMVELACLRPSGERILEPSAGTGRIVDALGGADSSHHIVAIELNVALADSLARRYAPRVEVIQADFLELSAGIGEFSACIMNPPFANGADIEHIQHAYSLLADEGRLVALCANGPKQNDQLRPWVESLGGMWEVLPPNMFAASGTAVNVVLLTVTKSL